MKVTVSPLVVIVGVVMAFTGRIQLFLSLIAAMVLHECAHAEVAKRLGYKLTRLKIMPYGAALSCEMGSASPSDELKIAIAGPLCSLFVYLVTVAVWWLCPDLYFFTEEFGRANLSLFLFNLLPVYPLDGGRVVRAIAWRRIKRIRLFTVITGVVFAALILLSFALTVMLDEGNYSLLLSAAFVIISAFIPDDKSKYARLYDVAYRTERCKRVLPVRYFAVTRATTVKKMKSKLSGDYFSIFLVVDDRFRVIPETKLDAEVVTIE